MRRHSTGVSLAEFVVSATLLGVVLLLTAPLAYRVAKDQRASHYANEMVATLNYARTQAVNRRQPITVCASRDGRQCSDTPWSEGYLVFIDNGAAGQVDAGDEVLRHTKTNNPKVMITRDGGRFVRFNPFGNLIARSATDADLSTQVAGWLERLSPITSAHAEYTPEPDIVTTSADTARPGAFIVCYRDRGRTISVSLQGRITTRPASCGK